MNPNRKQILASLLVFAGLLPVLAAQQQQPAQVQGGLLGPQQSGLLGGQQAAPPSSDLSASRNDTLIDRIRPNYVLGPNDQIMIRAFEAEEISDRPFRIDGDGFVNLPLVGRIRAGGLTVEKFEAELIERLKAFVRVPQVIVTVVQFRSEPVFFVGSFKTPGIYPLQGRRTLVEMLSSIGGLTPNASRRIKITRRSEFGKIPLPNAVEDPEAKTSSVEISLGSLRENVNPAEDIALEPFDVIAVARAELVYINGEVLRAGAFELGERDSISVTQLLTMAGGLSREAKMEEGRILRPVLETSKRAEIPVNVRKILAGQESDYPLQPNDILYIPRNGRRAALVKTLSVVAPLIPTAIFLGVSLTR